MSHIFISYSRKDFDFAQKIVDALAVNDLDTWVDWKSIPPSVGWEDEIYRGVEEADAFLFLISPDSVRSKMCNAEIAHAVQNGKRIVTILIRETDTANILKEVSEIQWIKCREGHDDFKKAIAETLKTIHTDYEWLKYHTRLQVKALEWKRRQDTSRLLRGKELQEAELRLNSGIKNNQPIPTKLQYEYVKASRSFETHQLRRLFIISVGVIITMIILSAFGLYQRSITAERDKRIATEIVTRKTAESQTIKEASQRKSQQLGTFSLEQLNDNPDLALLLGVEANQLGDTYQAKKALAASLSFTRCIGRYYYTDDASVTDVRLSSDGNKLFAGNVSGDINIWNLSNGTIDNFPGVVSITRFDINFDSSILAVSNTGNGFVTILDSRTLGKVSEINTSFDTIYDLKFGNQKNILAIAGNTPPYIELWDVNSSTKIIRSFRSQDEVFHQNYVYEIAFSSDDTLLAAAGGVAADGLIIIWDLTSDQNTATYLSPPDDVAHPIAFEALGPGFSYGNYQQIFGFGVGPGNDPVLIDTPSNVRSLIFKPSGTALISGHDDGRVRWWDLLNLDNVDQKARLEDVYTGHGDISIESLSILDDASLMASGDKSGKVVLWNPHDCHPEYNYNFIDAIELISLEDVTGLAVNANTRRMAFVKFGSEEIHLLDLDDMKELEILKDDSDQIGLLTFSNSGNQLAAVESESWNITKIRIWDIDSPSRQNKMVDISLLPNISAITFDSSESVLTLGASDGRIYFYNLANDRLVAEPIIHSDQDVTLLAFSPDGRLLASADEAGKIILWDTSTYMPIDEKIFSIELNMLSTMYFTEDSQRLFLSNLTYNNSNLLIHKYVEYEWNVSPLLWSQLICDRVGRNLTKREWERYFPGESYHFTCPQWPAGE